MKPTFIKTKIMRKQALAAKRSQNQAHITVNYTDEKFIGPVVTPLFNKDPMQDIKDCINARNDMEVKNIESEYEDLRNAITKLSQRMAGAYIEMGFEETDTKKEAILETIRSMVSDSNEKNMRVSVAKIIRNGQFVGIKLTKLDETKRPKLHLDSEREPEVTVEMEKTYVVMKVISKINGKELMKYMQELVGTYAETKKNLLMEIGLPKKDDTYISFSMERI